MCLGLSTTDENVHNTVTEKKLKIRMKSNVGERFGVETFSAI